jgi:MFS family permease
VTFSAAVGALTMKTVAARILRRIGFRTVLAVNALVSAVFIAACAAFRPGTPFWLIIPLLLVGGFFRSLQFTSINAIAYAQIKPELMSRATTLSAVGQQLSISTGVALGAGVVELAVHRSGAAAISAADFPAAFLVIAAITASSVLMFLQLPRDAGAELATRPR